MRLKIIDDIQTIIEQAKRWLMLEMEYAKLNAAEKLTTILTFLIIGFISALFGFVALILFGFALVELFKLIMAPALAFLTVGGIIIFFLVLLLLFRQPLLFNPLPKHSPVYSWLLRKKRSPISDAQNMM